MGLNHSKLYFLSLFVARGQRIAFARMTAMNGEESDG